MAQTLRARPGPVNARPVRVAFPARRRTLGRVATSDQVRALARFARARIREELGGPPAVPPLGDWCGTTAATFVSLHWHADGRLQGCIGSLEPRRALVDDVAHNAVAAALADPRAAPLSLADVDALDVEVSVLSPLERLDAPDEAAARAALRPGVDGVVLAWGRHRATFLPQMWPYLGDAATLLRELRRKAGLPDDFWSPEMAVSRYTVESAVDAPGRR
jgi:AmmeMemoRadiSam system protein A